jgi:hypothetical protein
VNLDQQASIDSEIDQGQDQRDPESRPPDLWLLTRRVAISAQSKSLAEVDDGACWQGDRVLIVSPNTHPIDARLAYVGLWNTPLLSDLLVQNHANYEGKRFIG